MKLNTEQLGSVSVDAPDTANNLKITPAAGASADLTDGAAVGWGCENAATMTDGEKIDYVAARVLEKYRAAFEELAK